MEINNHKGYFIYESGIIIGKRGRPLKTYMLNNYHYIKIEKKAYLISRLVAIHYIPNPNNLPEVDHINRDKNDNSVKNLRWVDRSTNCENKDIISTNTSGIKNVSYHKGKGLWIYQKKYNKVKFERSSLNKILILWIKFVYEITD